MQLLLSKALRMIEKFRITMMFLSACTVLVTAVFLVGRLMMNGDGTHLLLHQSRFQRPNIPLRVCPRSRAILPRHGSSRQIHIAPFGPFSEPAAVVDPKQQLLEGLEAVAGNPNAVANEMVLTFFETRHLVISS